jgi:DNA-binding transcriptional LysR family regulator
MKPANSVSPEAVEEFVMRRMSLRQLRVLQALAETSSLSAAAETLHVTQPAISKTLSELEQSLGQTLVLRRDRNIRLTPMAQRLVELGTRMETLLRRGAEEIASMARGASGELLIGVTNAALTDVLYDALQEVKLQCPQLAISVRTHALATMLEDLRGGRLDAVLARQLGDAPDELHQEVLLPTHEVVAISTKHPLASQRKIDWATLSDQAWIWPLPGTQSRARRDSFWRSLGLPLPSNVLQTDDLSLTLGMLKRSPLVTIMPSHIAQAAAREGVVRILPMHVELGLGGLCIWHLRGPQPMAVQRLKDALHAVIGSPQS